MVAWRTTTLPITNHPGRCSACGISWPAVDHPAVTTDSEAKVHWHPSLISQPVSLVGWCSFFDTNHRIDSVGAVTPPLPLHLSSHG
uniref:Uncharacterized protein n=1 Tax=Arundo donax TaxID=35708 RepID=A0A0A9HJK0_ARUDO